MSRSLGTALSNLPVDLNKRTIENLNGLETISEHDLLGIFKDGNIFMKVQISVNDTSVQENVPPVNASEHRVTTNAVAACKVP